MNIKKILGIGLVCSGAVLAQTAAPTASSAPAAPAQEAAPAAQVQPAPAQAPAAPAAEQTQVAEPVQEQATPAAETASEVTAEPAVESVVPQAEPVQAEPVQEQAAALEAPKADSAEKPAAETAAAVPVAEPAAPVASAAAESAAPADRSGPPPANLPKFRKKTAFDMIHGSAYNRVGNEAAADNVDALLTRSPMKFADQKFFYVEPAAERGIASFGSFFGALDISDSLGRMTLGYAMRGFGIALKAGIGRVSQENSSGKSYVTEMGDDLGLVAGLMLAGYAISLNVDWNAYAQEEDTTPKFGPSVDDSFHNLVGSLTLTNAPIAKNVVWTVGAAVVRHVQEKKVGGASIDAAMGSFTMARPFFNIGVVGLQNEYARLLVGLNSAFPITIYDKRKGVDALGQRVSIDASHFEAILTPNLLGEFFLNDIFMFFGEVNYEWLAFGYYKDSELFDKDESKTISHMDRVNADIGIRIQYKQRVACEFAFGESFFTDTKAFFNGEGVFVSFGAFLYF